MAEHFDAVVVGSGFGGGASALRLAEAGRSVLVLERGKRYPPGSFARSPRDMSRNFWDPSEGLQGLFDIWSFRGLEAVVASGLGGGSLIYANVLLRKDEKWFVREDRRRPGYEHWPVTREDLDPCYQRAEDVLSPNVLPYPDTPKAVAMRDAAARMGADFDLAPIAVSFGAGVGEPLLGAPPNLHGATRFGCRMCGECDVGCNFGSKNTVDLTYLSAAARASVPAIIRDRCEVRRFAPVPGGWSVSYVHHSPDNEGVHLDTSRLPERTVRCKVLVLSAGTLGSTYLLLRNRSALRGLSPQVGTRFCGNGDLLGFVSRSRSHVLDPANGPVITTRIRVADEADGGERGVRGYYVEEGGYPEFANWIVETSTISNPVARALRMGWNMAWSKLRGVPKSQIGVQLSSLVGDGRWSAGSMPLLGMGRDVADGRMRLRRGWLDVDWTTATSWAYFERVRATQMAIARALDADFVDNPSRLLRRVVTVHPLGGCPMGRDRDEGVVDDHGEVFGHPGLFVADGSVMPGPVGANPSLTIAALAERFSERMIERSGRAPS
ncbi:MAG TPA: GMC family oxidoreductase [Acidimicrobiales bacterium]|jgi:cholesterol oxidase